MGLVDRIRRQGPKAQMQQHALAMVLLPSQERPDGRSVFRYLRTHWPDVPSIANVEAADAATTARIPGGAAALMHVSAPVSIDHVTVPATLAWHWPTAAAELERHRSHVIVHTSSGTLDALDIHLLHSKLVASLAALTNAIGVFVGEAMLVRSAKAYIDEAREGSRSAAPIMLWVGFNPVRDERALSAYTTGLEVFGLPELEVRGTTRSERLMIGMMADAASYQLQTGHTLRDGETFGYANNERIGVRHTRSQFLPDTMVALLAL
jgi:hypothetical protein